MKTFSKFLAGAVAVLAIASTAGVAQATPTIQYSTDDSTWTTVSNPTLGFLVGTLTVGITAANSDDGPPVADIISTVLNITNTGSTTQTIYFQISDNGFTEPTAPPILLLNNHIGGTTGSAGDLLANALAIYSCVDPSNALFACPADSTTSAATPDIAMSGSFDGDTSLSFSSLDSPYSLTQHIALTLGEKSSVGWQARTELSVVPEPPTLALLGAALLGVGFLQYRRKRAV